jgi:sulfate transport system substrate-binding protein
MKLWQSTAQRWKVFISLFLVGLLASGTIASCSPSNAQTKDVEITLVSFVVTKAAYRNILPKFAALWKQQQNQNVLFNETYGPSGPQTRAVLDGLDADVVNLALALDVKKIEKDGLIAKGWEKKVPSNGIVTKSVAAIVTRKGNPKGIKNWEDLAKDGVEVITANPKTSGGARWNFLALWGGVTQTGGDESQAFDFTKKIYTRTPVLPKDARESSDVFFNQEKGDALINYENEILFAAQRGEKSPYIVPDVNISIENPVAVVDKNVDRHGNRKVVEAFVNYLFTEEAQREFAKVGFRPVNEIVAQEFATQYPPVKKLFTVQELGGWKEVQAKFFADKALFDKIQLSRK